MMFCIFIMGVCMYGLYDNSKDIIMISMKK